MDCDPGWTRFGDITIEGYGPDCLIHHEVIRIMSYVCVIIPSICNILIIRHYMSLATRKKSCYVITREYKTIFPLCFLIMGTGSLIFGILKLSYPDGQQPLIGRDLSVSLMALIVTAFCFIGLILYLHVIIQFLQGYKKMMDSASRERVSRRLNFLKFCSWFIIPCILMVSLMPLIAIAYPSQTKQLGMAYLIGFGIMAFAYGLITCSCLGLLIRELKVHISNMDNKRAKDVKLVVWRLKAAYVVVGGEAVVYGIFCICFASSKLLFHLTTYFILFAYTCMSPLTFVFVMTVARISTGSDDSKILPTSTSGSKQSLKPISRNTSYMPRLNFNATSSFNSNIKITSDKVRLNNPPFDSTKAKSMIIQPSNTVEDLSPKTPEKTREIFA
jgi:hypothetical protein